MNILHISCVAPPQTGGTGQAAYEIVRRLRDRGHEARLVAPQRKDAGGEPDPDWVIRLPSLIRWGNAAALIGVERMMREADVVHLHYPFFGTAEAVAQFCLLHRKPLMMTFHMDATAPFPLGLVFSAYRLAAQPAILRACRRIFVSSFDYADHSSLRGFKAARPDIFVELPFGVDQHLFTIGNDERTAFGIPEGAFVVGFAAAMDHAHRFKGIEELLAAVSGLSEHVHLLLIGEGDRRRIYEARAKEIGIHDRTHFVGRLSRQDLARAYRSMDVFAFPSTNTAEAFGLVAAEAMACGTPVIASDLPGVRTVVRNGETGLLIPPRDVKGLATAISSLMSDSTLRYRLRDQASVYARDRFDWDRHVDTLVGNYQNEK